MRSLPARHQPAKSVRVVERREISMSSPPEPVGGAQLRIAAALERLDPEEWAITPIPGAVTSTRQWSDGSVDTVILLSTETAYGHRRDPDGQTVWALKGSVGEVISAALRLAPPKSPDAPGEPIPERTEPGL
jgi:hypothetical protein